MADFSLKAVFGIDATGAKTELKQLRGEVSEFATNLAKLGAGAAVAGFTALAHEALAMGAALRDASEQIGINVESLQVLNYVAEQNGTTQEAMRKALEKTRIGIQKASEGSTEHVAALSKLNLKYAELMALPIEQQFAEIARAYSESTDKAEAYNAVTAIFGEKVGPKMIAALQDLGENGFAAAAESAAAAGKVMSGETVVALERADQAIQDFKKSATIAVGEILVDFKAEGGIKLLWLQLSGTVLKFGAGILDAIVEAASMFGATFDAGIEWIAQNFVNAFISGLQVVAKELNRMLPAGMQISIMGLEALKEREISFGDRLAAAISQTEPSQFKKTIGEANDALVAEQRKIVDAAKAIDLGPQADKLRAAGDGFTSNFFEQFDKGTMDFIMAVDYMGQTLDAGAQKLEEAVDGIAEDMNRVVDRYEAVGRKGRNYEDQSTPALEGVFTRLTQQILEISRTQFERGFNFTPPEVYILQAELNNVNRELANRREVTDMLARLGEDATRRAVGDTPTDKALREIQGSNERTTTAVESVAIGLRNLNRRLGVTTN